MKILFQGDSITDAGRVRDDDNNVGCGYALMVKADLGLRQPGEHQFINRGVAGNRVTSLYARLEMDIIGVKPDFMSLLVGVNDVWCKPEKFYKIYDMLIEETKEALPETKIMLLEPFVLRGSHTEECWEDFRTGVPEKAQVVRQIAEKYQLPFVPLQAGFDALAQKMGVEYWLRDGVHPTPMGHAYIRDRWLEAFAALQAGL